ncbi:unnamed protein product [Polarella glacialis]|uniref:BTB domain-containing protein n=1 Tax=Polarella glacialis TaxID=89957 RepID=A0A813K1V1_POLGL|nr:unnamed protein product [Polarella glacialis]CAE8692708.1 unnamed protein product [Polarella glacialis]
MPATIKFNVGGTIFEVAQDTLRSKSADTLLNVMLERWTQNPCEPQFIDRDPELFRYILAWYRDDGCILLPITISKAEILREAEFFGLPMAACDIETDVTELGQMRKRILEVDRQRLQSSLNNNSNNNSEKSRASTTGLWQARLKEIHEEMAEDLSVRCSQTLETAVGQCLAQKAIQQMQGQSSCYLFKGDCDQSDWLSAVSWDALHTKEVLTRELARSGYSIRSLSAGAVGIAQQ